MLCLNLLILMSLSCELVKYPINLSENPNFLALTKIDSNVSVIIASILPLTVAFFSWFFFKTKLGFLGLSGLIVGLFGVLLIMLQRVEEEYEMLGITLCFMGLLATTFSTLIITCLLYTSPSPRD